MNSFFNVVKGFLSKGKNTFQLGKTNVSGDNNTVSTNETDNSTQIIDNSDHSIHNYGDSQDFTIHNPLKGMIMNIAMMMWIVYPILSLILFFFVRNLFNTLILVVFGLSCYAVVLCISFILSTAIKNKTQNKYPFWMFGVLIFLLLFAVISLLFTEKLVSRFVCVQQIIEKLKHALFNIFANNILFSEVRQIIFQIYLVAVTTLLLYMAKEIVINQNNIYLKNQSLGNTGLSFIIKNFLIYIFIFLVYLLIK